MLYLEICVVNAIPAPRANSVNNCFTKTLNPKPTYKRGRQDERPEFEVMDRADTTLSRWRFSLPELLAPNTSEFLIEFESKDDKGDDGGVAKVRGIKEYSGRRKALKALDAIAVQQCR